jgi:Flp pilus assembly protein CpaB
MGPQGATMPEAKKLPTKRKTRTSALAAVLLALVAGMVLFVGTGTTDDTVYAYRAKDLIAVRTPLTADMFDAVAVDPEVIPSDAITAPSAEELAAAVTFDGMVNLFPISAGTTLTTAMLSVDGMLSDPLAADERLISVSATFGNSVAGSLRVGDRVDVIGIGGSTLPVAQLLVTDVEVVAIAGPEDSIASAVARQFSAAEGGDQVTREEVLPADPIPGVYTLRVRADQATRLAIVSNQAYIFLSYRGPEASDTSLDPVDLAQVICGTPVLSGLDLPPGSPITLPRACRVALGLDAGTEP